MRGYWPQQTDDTTGISEYLNNGAVVPVDVSSDPLTAGRTQCVT